MAIAIAAATTHATHAQSVIVDGNGNGDYTTIQAAIDWSPPDTTTIYITPGTYIECVNITNRTLSLQSTDPSQKLIVYAADWSACAGGTAILTVDNADVTLQNITLQSDALYARTGIDCTDSTVNLEHVTIMDGSMAGITVAGASMLSLDFTTIQNGDGRTGLDIDNSMTGTVTIANSTLLGHPNVGGRGLSSMSTQAEINIQDTTFDGHQAAIGHGSGIKVAGGTLNLLRTAIQNATTDTNAHGAGLLCSGQGNATVVVVDCTFSDNEVAGYGGGAYVSADAGDNVTFHTCVFANNIIGTGALNSGGSGLYIDSDIGANVTVHNCAFYDNTRQFLSDSSAVFIDGNQAVDLTDCLFCGNQDPPIAGNWNDADGNSFVNSCSQGACCYGNAAAAACADTTQSDCIDLGGTWQGAGTDCATTLCSLAADGACCLGGYCLIMNELDCLYNEGQFLGQNTPCVSAGCIGMGVPPTAACCISGTCVEATETLCIDAGGTWSGIGTQCATANCPPACGGDVNFDGIVNMSDLIELLGNWGTCP
jgi:hypothetical protein